MDDVVSSKKFKTSVVGFMPYKGLDEGLFGFNAAKTNDTSVLLENDVFFDNFLFKNTDS